MACRYYTLLAWLPSFFELALGLNVQSSSLLTLIPYIAMVLMTPFVGPVADGLVKRGWSLTNVRKLAQVRPRMQRSKSKRKISEVNQNF